MDAPRIVLPARVLRGVADGLVSVLLVPHLTGLGFGADDVGTVVTATLLGSAALTIAVGLTLGRVDPRRVLVGAAVLMVATGLGFAAATTFWPIVVLALLGTLNPSAGDVTLFLPTEQALLAGAVRGPERTRLFARYNLGGAVAGAVGALGAAAVASVATRPGTAAFVVYAAVGVVVTGLYGRLRVPRTTGVERGAGLGSSRALVLRLAALFSLDAFGGGFVVQSLLVLWLGRRFALSIEAIGLLLFVAGVCGAVSQLASAWLARRIGLVNTMVYTHLPANALLIVAGVVPHAGVAVGCLLVRALLSQMDVPARQSYVMAVVAPEERAAAASVTAVPRSLAAAVSPVLAGWMLERSTFGWPLVCAGVLKASYDVLLLARFRRIRPDEHR